MTGLLHELAAVCYAGSALLGWRALATGRRVASAPWVLALGVLIHGAGFAVLHGEDPPIPLESFPAALSLIGWLIAAAYLCSMRFADVRGVGLWVAAAAAVFTGIAWVDLLVGPTAVRDSAGSGAWSHAHVLVSALGFSLLALASVAGLAYLVKERALKHKSRARLGLPSLESLDRMEHFTLAAGFPLLTLGVATGFAWGMQHGVEPWTAHTFFLLLAWLVYLLPMGLRVVRRQHGERPARSVVLGFGVLAFAYLGVRLLGGGA